MFRSISGCRATAPVLFFSRGSEWPMAGAENGAVIESAGLVAPFLMGNFFQFFVFRPELFYALHPGLLRPETASSC